MSYFSITYIFSVDFFLVNASKPNGLFAFKPNVSCYKVQWLAEDSGNCLVNYTVALVDSNSKVLHPKSLSTKSAEQKSIVWCFPKCMDDATARVTVQATGSSENYLIPVSQTPPTGEYELKFTVIYRFLLSKMIS